MSEEIRGELDHELNARYRLFTPIEIDDGGHKVRGYGDYGGKGTKDCKSWEQVTKLWTPDTKIFARLPIHQEDLQRAIEGKKPHVIITKYSIEKYDKPFGYGETDYWFFYRFRNIGKKEAAKIVTNLAEKGCTANKFPVGLELRVGKQELTSIANHKRREIEQRVFTVLRE